MMRPSSGSSRFHTERSSHQLTTAHIPPCITSLCSSAAAHQFPICSFTPSAASGGVGLIHGRWYSAHSKGKKKHRNIRQENTQEFLIAFRVRFHPGGLGKSAPCCGLDRLCCSMQWMGRRGGEVGYNGVEGVKTHVHAARTGRGFTLG